MVGFVGCEVTVEVQSTSDTAAEDTTVGAMGDTTTSADAMSDDASEPGPAPVCVPSCFGQDCGDDGCGGSCGACTGGPTYMISTLVKGDWTFYQGQVKDLAEDLSAELRHEVTTFTIDACTANCGDAICGDDGCGGTCGSCGDNQHCVSGLCAGVGDVTVTLQWDTAHDLDLHVIDPSGDELKYDQKTSPSGGELDIDAHAGCSAGVGVENVFWPTGGAPDGVYQVFVNNYSACDAGAGSFTVTVSAYGVTESYTYDIGAESEKAYVLEFDLEACVGSCDGKSCGDDGCGGSCGACGEGQSCLEGTCAGTGDVQVTLEWATGHDLDIFVTDPDGALIYYGEADTAASGGILDIDSHAACEGTESYGIENIYWPTGGAPAGTYTVEVNKAAICGASEADYSCNAAGTCAP